MSDLPEGWAWAKLGELLTELRSGIFVSRPGTEDTGRPILRISAVRPMTLDIGSIRYIPRSADVPNEASYHLSEGDLLFTRYSGSPELVGACARVCGQIEGMLYPDKLIRGKVIPGAAHPAYIEAAMSAPETRDIVRTLLKTTAGQVGISGASLRSVPIPLPPYEEQLRIAAAIEEQFSRLDDGLIFLHKARQNLQIMRDAVFGDAMEQSATGILPKVPFGSVLREPLRNGFSAKADPLGTIPIITLTAVTSGDFGVRNIKMTAADPSRVRGLWIQPGDLLIERSNTPELVGTACLYRGEIGTAVYPDLIIRARVDDRVIPEYAELALKSPAARRYFRQKAQGISGSMPKISQQTIEEFDLPLPSLEKQTSIVQEANRKLHLATSLNNSLELADKRCTSLRSSILSAACSGKLI